MALLELVKWLIRKSHQSKWVRMENWYGITRT